MGEANNKYQDYLKNPNQSSLYLNEIEPHEIEEIMMKLDIKKAIDIYGISPKLVKISANVISNPLCIIFNKSFQEGMFPNMLKTANIFPIYKADSKLKACNYRPISILPILSKILEKLMHQRIIKFITKHKILYEHQFGFQKGKSTEHAILDVYNKIIESIQENKVPTCVFLDFAKAFDTVNHDILIAKLHHYGIRGLPQQWLKSYLENRKQCVQIGMAHSNFETVQCGVPQGSVLGPLLFLIYINDIHTSAKEVIFHLFADDTCIFFSHKDLNVIESTLNNALGKISNWLIANKLSLNVDKSNLVIFSLNKSPHQHDIKIHINNELLEPKDYAKYLGLSIDSKLTWRNHIDNVNNKLVKGVGILSKLRYYVNEKTLITLYNAFIQPHINYGICAWGSAAKSNVNKIDNSSKKAVRIMNFKNKYDDTLNLYKEMGILTVNLSIKFNNTKFIWQCINGKNPECIQQIFKLDTINLAINSTSHQKLQIPHRKTDSGQRFLTYAGAKHWNRNVPSEIANITQIKIFKNKYKEYLLSQSCS